MTTEKVIHKVEFKMGRDLPESVRKANNLKDDDFVEIRIESDKEAPTEMKFFCFECNAEKTREDMVKCLFNGHTIKPFKELIKGEGK